jgi:hypothetical protein
MRLRIGLKPLLEETKDERDSRYGKLERARQDRLEEIRRDNEVAATKRMNRIMIWGIAIAAIVGLAVEVVQHVDSTHAGQENSSHGR